MSAEENIDFDFANWAKSKGLAKKKIITTLLLNKRRRKQQSIADSFGGR